MAKEATSETQRMSRNWPGPKRGDPPCRPKSRAQALSWENTGDLRIPGKEDCSWRAGSPEECVGGWAGLAGSYGLWQIIQTMAFLCPEPIHGLPVA